jgi:hypothetical protein
MACFRRRSCPEMRLAGRPMVGSIRGPTSRRGSDADPELGPASSDVCRLRRCMRRMRRTLPSHLRDPDDAAEWAGDRGRQAAGAPRSGCDRRAGHLPFIQCAYWGGSTSCGLATPSAFAA